MASHRKCVASFLRPLIEPSARAQHTPSLLPFLQTRAAHSDNAAKYKKKEVSASTAAKKKKARQVFLKPDLRKAEQFALCDAIRYIRAFEVGRDQTSSKYELSISLRTPKNGPVLRNRFRLPVAVATATRICVICPPEGKQADAARAAGAVLIGEETVFDAVRAGEINFERCVCHADSAQKLQKANLGRILGPRGLMPSPKTGTVVKDVASALRNMVGASEYRERLGVVRAAIGQLAYSPEQLQQNIRAFVDHLKREIDQLGDRGHKEVHEVVLSSTHSPGFSLNGDFRSERSLPTAALSVP